MNYFLVFIGGGVGCVLRYMFSLWWQKSEITFPFSTLIANGIAAIALAFLYFLPVRSQYFHLWLLLATGFCGGLSTFSTFSLETFMLFRQGEIFYAWLNIALSVGFCIGLFYLIGRFFQAV